MKSILTSFGAAGLCAAIALAAIAPATSAFAQSGRSNQQQGEGDNHFERRGSNVFLNNQQGYSQQRSGYRYYNGFWFPPTAFIAGIIIGGALANTGGSDHEQWCYAHYRSYRASDDTFQPNYGPRQYCVSPYG